MLCTSDPAYGEINEFHMVNAGIEGVKIYQSYRDSEAWKTLLLCYGGRFVLMHPGWEMTSEQIRTAAAPLAP